MRKSYLTLLILFAVLIVSCANNSKKAIYPPSEILLNQDSFWTYYYNHVNLADNFLGFDEHDKPLTRKDFFNKLASGYQIPISLETNDSLKHYKLYKITTAVDAELRDLIEKTFETDVKYFNMEGSVVPKFNFTDINGKKYNSETTKDQFVILKFWFIGCGACIEEMPALNKLVSKYSKKPNIKFLSLATDSEEKLKVFLSKTDFKYATASVSDNYVVDELGITTFPTHMIVKNGKILRVISTEKQLEDVLSRYQK